MISQEQLRRFVQLLTSKEDSLQISGEAFEIFSDSHDIGRVTFHFQVADSTFTHGGAEAEGVLYQNGDWAGDTAVFEREFHTGEKGCLNLLVSHKAAGEDWPEELREDLCVILDIFIIHMGRNRVIQQANRNLLTDFLTGLPNADGYTEQLEERFKQHTLSGFNAYYFNLKGFGLLNRKFGQKETDQIVLRYIRILRDFIDQEELLGRLGGDNYVALIKKEHTQEFLKLLSGVETYGVIGKNQIPVVIRAVAGVFELDDDLQSWEPIITRAALAMNVAKNVEKKPCVFATKELSRRVYRQKKIIDSFPGALEQEEFVVYYQPKVNTDNCRMVGAEALVRWIRDGKMVPPGDFVPIVEQDGSVCRLDFYVLEHVCRDIRRWLDQGLEPVRVSVNFSRKHLSNPHLAGDIMAVIGRYHVPVEYIEIEVTETTDEEEQGMLSRFLVEMREQRITTAIDDFGTGYSSLNVLRSFPVDVLKIDKSFIDAGTSTENDEIVLSHIIHMAQDLHMEVITEGVESWEQAKFLRAMDCNLVQGFLFDRPMPPADFERKLHEKQYAVGKL